MNRNMLKWHSWRKYSGRDLPYARLEDSLDTTNGGYLKTHTIKTKSLRNIRSSDKSKASTRSLRRRDVISNARDGESNEIPRDGTGVSENSSFLTISSEELHFEDSYTRSEVSAMENMQSPFVERNTFRKLSKNSKASMAKMSSKWCKIKDSFVSLRKPSLPEVVDNQWRRSKIEGVKPLASSSSKNLLELLKRTNSCYNKNRLSSHFLTGCDKLNSDSSPDMIFDGEGALHSTLIQQRKVQKADKRMAKKLKGSRKTISLSKIRRRRGKDSFNFRKLSVRSSGSKVEVKISLTLSNSGNRRSSTSGETTKCYLNSPLRTVDLTPVLPKRPLSRRSLFSNESNVTESIAYKQTQLLGYDEARCNDSIIVQNLTAAPGVEENRTYLSPGVGEIGVDELITPPSRQIIVSVAQIDKCRRRERKQRGVIVASGNK